MTQQERQMFLIQTLLEEQPVYEGMEIPETDHEQKRLLRALMNVRLPKPASEEFLKIQNSYLQEETARKGVTEGSRLAEREKGISLWQGDITTLRADAIVNAANSQMLGCFVPCHGCIDNMIHTYAGVQLRLACAKRMEQRGRKEPTGGAMLTPAFNLPSSYVIHTVGPVVSGPLTKRHEAELASCYQSCLKLAEERGIESLAFCCISTGEFHFPNQRAAEIAVKTVRTFLKEREMKVIFNVFKDRDREIYERLLGSSPRG